MTEQTTVENWVDQATAIERGEAPADKVFKLTGENSVTSSGPDKPAGEPYKTQHAKVLRFEISVGNDDDDTTLEQFEAAAREALAFARDHGPSVFVSPDQHLNFHNLTTMGGYYIIDGKVCLAQDYDPATKNRKPGTYPPVWAGGPTKEEIAQTTRRYTALPRDTEDDSEREFVHVTPTKPRRDPVTGVKPRKPRSDKGVKRGPKSDAEKAKAREAIARMRNDLKETK